MAHHSYRIYTPKDNIQRAACHCGWEHIIDRLDHVEDDLHIAPPSLNAVLDYCADPYYHGDNPRGVKRQVDTVTGFLVGAGLSPDDAIATARALIEARLDVEAMEEDTAVEKMNGVI